MVKALNINKKFNIHLIIGIGFILYLMNSNYLFDYLLKVKNENSFHNFSLPKETLDIRYGIDTIEQVRIRWKEVLRISGWAFIGGDNAKSNRVFLVLKSSNNTYIFDTNSYLRYDLPVTFNNQDLNLERAGFTTNISSGVIKDGRYRLGIYIESDKGKFFTFGNDYISKRGDNIFKGFTSTEQNVNLPKASKNLVSAIDIIRVDSEESEKNLEISGWAFIKDRNITGDNVYVVLKSDKDMYVFDTVQIKRPDITKAFGANTNQNLDNSGFKGFIPWNSIKNGTYELGICLKYNGETFYSLTDKYFTKDNELLKSNVP